MDEQVARFVASDVKQPLPPPSSDIGFPATLRKNLFATPTDAILTVVFGALVLYVGWQLLNWAVLDAVFTGTDRTACLVADGGHGGACWAFVRAKFEQFIYGTYPVDQRWRVNAVFILLAVLVVLVAAPKIPYKRYSAIALFAVFPVVSLILLTGGEFDIGTGFVAFLMALASGFTVAAAAGRPEVGGRGGLLRIAGGLTAVALVALLASGFVSSKSVEVLDYRFTLLAFVSLLASVASVGVCVAVTATAAGMGSAAKLLVPTGIVLLLATVLVLDYGMPFVPTNLWGGLLVTLVVALCGITASLPIGILLALGRRSKMPAIKLLSVIFIEFWRGVPLITVLFMSNFMLPLFLPQGMSFNQLLRVLIGVALFSAAYMAEVIRGGLQAIPKGQYEAADAMALTYWQKMRMIVLPQALKLVIPGIVNTFIGLFKDTSLVYIIGIADLLGTVRRGFSDPNWITPSTPATGLVFAAFVFWLFCFSMSRYSISVERRLDTGHKR